MNAGVSFPNAAHNLRLGVLAGVHFAINVILVSNVWFLNRSTLMIVLAIPLSQLSLSVLWALAASTNALLRYLIPVLGIAACWFLMSRILPWGIGEPASAGWAIALVCQTITIFVSAIGARLLFAIRPKNEQESQEQRVSRPIRFGVGTLMLWTTAVG